MAAKDIDTQLIASRLINLMKALGFKNELQWSAALGYERADNLYNATNGERMPGVALLADISNKFENVNVGWILSGKGTMLYENEKSGPLQVPDQLLTQIEDHANSILFSLDLLRKKPLVVPGKETTAHPRGFVQRANTSDKKKTEKRPKGK